MAGAVFGDLAVSLFVAGAIFGDVAVSLFVAGAAFGDVGARHAVIFNTKCVSEARKLTSRTGGCEMTGSFSDHGPQCINDISSVFSRLLLDFGVLFCVAGAVFGEVGGSLLLLRAL